MLQIILHTFLCAAISLEWDLKSRIRLQLVDWASLLKMQIVFAQDKSVIGNNFDDDLVLFLPTRMHRNVNWYF